MKSSVENIHLDKRRIQALALDLIGIGESIYFEAIMLKSRNLFFYWHIILIIPIFVLVKFTPIISSEMKEEIYNFIHQYLYVASTRLAFFQDYFPENALIYSITAWMFIVFPLITTIVLVLLFLRGVHKEKVYRNLHIDEFKIGAILIIVSFLFIFLVFIEELDVDYIEVNVSSYIHFGFFNMVLISISQMFLTATCYFVSSTILKIFFNI